MLLARRLDERAWVLHRQGKIAFHISGIGQEAAQVGAAFALRRGTDWCRPYYRDLALMLALGLYAARFHAQPDGQTANRAPGRGRCPAIGACERANVISHSSPVATQASHAAGIGWRSRCAATTRRIHHHRRGLDLARRVVRGGQLGGGPQAAGDLHGREQPVCHLCPPGPADGGCCIRRTRPAGWACPASASTGWICWRSTGGRGGSGPRPGRRRPDGDRGTRVPHDAAFVG